MPTDSANPLGLIRIVAWSGLIASLLGRALAPALQGAGHGLDRAIEGIDLAAGFATFSFAILTLLATSLQLVHTAREAKLGLPYRIVAIALGALVVALVTPAVPLRLPDSGILITAVSSALLAIIAAGEGVRSASTRAVGFALGLVGLAALLHLTALHLSASPLPRMLFLSASLSTASIALHGLSVLIAFMWLSTRSPNRMSVPVASALSLATFAFLGARDGALEGASLWQIVAHRSVAELTTAPSSFVLPEVVQAIELGGLALAGAALVIRGQVASLAASLALLLIARPMTDVPLSATAIALAALTVGMGAVRD